MSKPVIHSHSALKMYENCPRQYQHLRILKDIKDVMGKEGEWGDLVHKAIDAFMKSGAPLPANAAQYQQLVDFVREIPCDELQAELKLSIRRDGSACAFFDNSGYLRGVVDVLLLQGDKAIIIDWKTGKSKYGPGGQDARNALIIFGNFPQIQDIFSRFIYVKDGHIEKKHFTREQIPQLREDVDKLDADIKWSLDNNAWPTRPSPLCGWCAVNAAGKCKDAHKRR